MLRKFSKFKIICSYNRLRACTFSVRRKCLRAHYAHTYECACDFHRPSTDVQYFDFN